MKTTLLVISHVVVLALGFWLRGCFIEAPAPEIKVEYRERPTVLDELANAIESNKDPGVIKTLFTVKREPDKVEGQRITDTVVQKQIEQLMPIYSVEETRNGLRLVVYDQYGKVLRQETYTTRGDFSITSTDKGVIVRDNVYRWRGVYFGYEAAYPLNKWEWEPSKLNHSLTMKTGVSWKRKLSLNAGIKYVPELGDVSATAEVTYNPFGE